MGEVRGEGPVRIDRLGAEGDGIAPGPLYLANTLPGELVQPRALTKRGGGWAGEADLLEPSRDRVPPPCPHFGPCGGCTLQHWADAPYAEWKRARVAAAACVDPGPLARTPQGARRRMDFAIRRDRGAVRIGLHHRRSADIVDLYTCPILDPALFGIVPSLRTMLRSLDGLRRQADLSANLLDDGPDLLLATDADLSARDRSLLAAWAASEGVLRVSWQRIGRAGSEPAAALRPATITFSGRGTALPPGAFLQASKQGERAIVDAVLAALPPKLKGPIVELFAGTGSLTHALASRSRVLAFEGDADAVDALRRAGNSRVTATRRDLVRQPLGPAELRGAGAIVLDPPYTGAAPQMASLALSRAPIIYVSCNQAALARDAKPLLAAGYRPTSAAAIDQFLWSAQVESVVAFRAV